MKEESDRLSQQIIGAAIEVHQHLGPGLLESTYVDCLCYELTLRQIPYANQVLLPVAYKGVQLDCGYSIDIVVADLVVVELRAVDALEAVHETQVLTYLRLTQRWLGLLINFNVPILKQGIKRVVNE